MLWREMSSNRSALMVAALAVLIALAWQWATVACNFQGKWIGLFYLGDRWPLPPQLTSEYPGLLGDAAGYDGLFYHLVSHDPLLTRGFWQFADNSSLRWRRILVPGLAYLLALGDDVRVHAAYVAVNLLFILAGAFWLARFSALNGMSPVWGLAFLLVPSVMVSIDRLTIDTSLAALTIGFLLYSFEGRYARSLVLLAFCPLSRETGLALSAGRVWQDCNARAWRRLALAVVSTLPFMFWCVFLAVRLPGDGTPWLSFPLAGLVRRTLHPVVYPITGRWVALAAVLDYLAVIGAWLALAYCVCLAIRRRGGLLERSLYVFAAGTILLGKADIWGGSYDFGRTLSPLFIMLGLIAIRDRNWFPVTPIACIVPRIFLQLEPQLMGILRHLI
jgi:hypothetical protein